MSVDDATRPLGLRERKKARTRALIAETALGLFLERGFEHVTVVEIARAADVAEGTVFNHFATKEDLVYGGMAAWEEGLLAAVRDRPPDRSVLDAFAAYVLAPRGLLGSQADPEHIAAVTRLIAGSPALMAREAQIVEAATAALAGVLAAEAGAAPDDIEAWTAAHALMGVHRGLLAHVRRLLLDGVAQPRLAREARALAERALALLAAGLEDYGARPEDPTRSARGG